MRWMDGWRARAGTVFNEPPKSPWGGKPGGSGGAGGGSGGGSSGGGGNDGPRNPWAFPPEGGRPRHGTSSTLDELLKRAKRGGGPNFTGGSGFPGGGAGMGKLWAIGIALIVALWAVFTSFHSISPQERGVVTFFGKYSGTLEPGIRPTLPAPFNQVTVEDVQNIREENFPASGTGENLMLTRDQNIVDLAYSVRWNIANLQDYVFQIKLPKETVRAAAESAMREVVSSVTLDQALGVGRTVIEARVQERLQQLLDDYNSGVRIQGIAISKADPPAQVNDDFKAVSAAQQQAQADLNNARAYAQQVLARAQGESAQFDKMYEQYKLAPEVTRRRMYYETMEQVLAKSNKTIVEAPGVTPYLPLPDAARRALPEPSGTTPPAVQQAQPAAGGAQ